MLLRQSDIGKLLHEVNRTERSALPTEFRRVVFGGLFVLVVHKFAKVTIVE